MKDFTLSVIASIVAAVICAVAAKIGLKRFLQTSRTVLPFFALTFIFFLIVLGSFKAVGLLSGYTEKGRLQARVDSYVEKNESELWAQGHRIEVVQTRPIVYLAFSVPDKLSSSGYRQHDYLLRSEKTIDNVTQIARDMGIDGAIRWGDVVRPLSAEEVNDILGK